MNESGPETGALRALGRPPGGEPARTRFAIIGVTVALALVIHLATGGRWTNVLVMFVAATTILSLLPAGLAWLAKPLIAYAGTWIVFNFLRAYADSMPWADAGLDLIPRLERWLSGGTIPSATLQRRFYDQGGLAWHDHALTAVYVTFFVAPHLVALLLLWRNRRIFWHYTGATMVLFSLAIVSFYALPTAPPWLIANLRDAGFASVHRVTEPVLANLDLPIQLFSEGSREGTGGPVRTSEVRVEPNPIAAMPSIHLAATAMIVGPARLAGKIAFGAAIVYTIFMGIALVYLGEHYALDLLVGAAMAALGWILAGIWLRQAQHHDTTHEGAKELAPR